MIFIPYVIGALAGIAGTIIYKEEEEKEKKAQLAAQPAQNAPVENPPTSEPQLLENNDGDNNDAGEGEEKEVKFVAKSRGKKK